ncbi:MAG TPA: YceI family protein [Fibrobacteria bacterium]|nr:YceI family protein [Fibrobacteria bacterium]
MRHSGIIHFGSLLLASALAATAHAATYNVDTAHSDVTFKVRHMGISTVTGKFEKFGGTFDVDPKNIKATKGNLTIDAASILTGNAKRDGHLKSADFFDVAKYPEIKFVSKEVKDIDMKDSTATLVGDLTMHGVTKEVLLHIKGGGIMVDPWGNERAAFTATGKIDRYDYGLKYNAALETGGVVVSQEVELSLGFEGMRPLAAAASAKAEKAESKPAKAKPAEAKPAK